MHTNLFVYVGMRTFARNGDNGGKPLSLYIAQFGKYGHHYANWYLLFHAISHVLVHCVQDVHLLVVIFDSNPAAAAAVNLCKAVTILCELKLCEHWEQQSKAFASYLLFSRSFSFTLEWCIQWWNTFNKAVCVCVRVYFCAAWKCKWNGMNA